METIYLRALACRREILRNDDCSEEAGELCKALTYFEKARATLISVWLRPLEEREKENADDREVERTLTLFRETCDYLAARWLTTVCFRYQWHCRR